MKERWRVTIRGKRGAGQPSGVWFGWGPTKEAATEAADLKAHNDGFVCGEIKADRRK